MAKRFRFRLEPLLKLRKGREDEQKRAVASRVGELQRCVEHLAQLHRGVDETIARAREDRGAERLDVPTALAEQRWRLHLKRCITQQQGQVQGVQALLNGDRAELVRRSRNRKVIETLRQRQWQEHAAAQAREERAESDEIGAQAYRRRRDQGT